MTLKLVWSEFKPSELSTVPTTSGIYIFLYQNIPFYVGESKFLQHRLKTHQQLFEQCKRTFILDSYPKRRWIDIFLESQQQQEQWLFIPDHNRTLDRSQIQAQSVKFWNSLRILIAPHDDHNDLKTIESRIQFEIRDKIRAELNLSSSYDFKIGTTDSTFFGKVEQNQEATLSVSLDHDLSRLKPRPYLFPSS